MKIIVVNGLSSDQRGDLELLVVHHERQPFAGGPAADLVVVVSE
jgi:hypothetical protein